MISVYILAYESNWKHSKVSDYYVNFDLMNFLSPDGFNSVFPMSKMGSFSPEEVRLMLCGDQVPSWTREDIIAYTEPKLGFTKERYDLSILTIL